MAFSESVDKNFSIFIQSSAAIHKDFYSDYKISGDHKAQIIEICGQTFFEMTQTLCLS